MTGSRWRGIALVILVWGTLCRPVGATESGIAPQPPEALQQAWNEHMMAGTFGSLNDGTAHQADSGACVVITEWIYRAADTGCGVLVIDRRERRFLKARGGWVLKGGLIGRLEFGNARIELYGKTIERHEPYLQPWPHVWIGNTTWTASHEVFLLHRAARGDRATVLRTWKLIDPERNGGSSLLPRGSLERGGTSTSVQVRVINAHAADLVSEDVDVSGALGKQ